jgi:hypothetical protein
MPVIFYKKKAYGIGIPKDSILSVNGVTADQANNVQIDARDLQIEKDEAGSPTIQEALEMEMENRETGDNNSKDYTDQQLTLKQNSLDRTVQTDLSSSLAAADRGGNLTPGVTGTLAVASGGTGVTTFSTLGGLLRNSTTSPTGGLETLTSGTAGQLLRSNGEGQAPSWVDGPTPSYQHFVTFFTDDIVLAFHFIDQDSTPIDSRESCRAKLATLLGATNNPARSLSCSGSNRWSDLSSPLPIFLLIYPSSTAGTLLLLDQLGNTHSLTAEVAGSWTDTVVEVYL